MTNKETILMDIQNHNDAGDMDFNKWMMWGITQIAIMTAMILDNVENMDHKAESEDV
jgi:hypothetical protein